METQHRDAIDPADVSRRHALTAIITALGGTLAAAVAAVVGGAVLAPAFARRQEDWVPAVRLRELPDGVPTAVTVRTVRREGAEESVAREVVFLVRSGDDVRALSSTCTHLGCRVSFDAESRHFRCPCHGGAYDATGRVVGGPPPRALASVEARVDGPRVLLKL